MLTFSRPLKVAVLCSARAPGLTYLLNRDPRRGAEYEIVCCISSEHIFAEQVRVERRGVPCVPHSIAQFCHDRGVRRTDMGARVDYDRETLELLNRYHPDIVVLDGYLLLVTDPLLRAFQGRIVNVHHSDLLQRNERGEVKYPGLRAVLEAFLGGEKETRASAHIVTETLDDGPVLLRSWAFAAPPVVGWAMEHDHLDVVRAAAWVHTEWMLREAWGPMLAGAIELAGVATERFGEPLNAALAGRWLLSADRSFTPDGAMLEVHP
jgi:folate-dependent phosphoribosylglycinamide formyltransferase PurN